MWQTFVSLHLALAQLWQPVPHTFALPQMFAAFFASITHTGSCIDVCLNTRIQKGQVVVFTFVFAQLEVFTQFLT